MTASRNTSSDIGIMPNDAPVGATHRAPADAGRRPGYWHRRAILFAPLAVFGGLAASFAVSLGRDVRLVPSPLIGKTVPRFDLPPVQGRRLGLSDTDLRGKVSLVNVFGSWCVACREEHPHLMGLARRGVVPVHGPNYKNAPDDAAGWLDAMGDPYTRTGADRNGRVALDWGVYGVPETYVVGADSLIAFKHIGAVTPQVLEDTILSLVERLRREGMES
ncbi:DsbE family thiol:disulfide interchange protein [Falsiroseomonas frigidaquae]|nr:DsbE family thiol:disulfide interchange protein [Falsiroseomonas frigidaquae]